MDKLPPYVPIASDTYPMSPLPSLSSGYYSSETPDDRMVLSTELLAKDSHRSQARTRIATVLAVTMTHQSVLSGPTADVMAISTLNVGFNTVLSSSTDSTIDILAKSENHLPLASSATSETSGDAGLEAKFAVVASVVSVLGVLGAIVCAMLFVLCRRRRQVREVLKPRNHGECSAISPSSRSSDSPYHITW